MKKKNIIVIAIMTICFLSNLCLLAQIVTFEENPDGSASNIQGKVYIWDWDLQTYVPGGSGLEVICLLYNVDNTIHGQATVTTDGNSFYSHDFTDPNNNSQYCNEVEVIFEGNHYTDFYDGCVRIDIYYRLPIEDPTQPNPE